MGVSDFSYRLAGAFEGDSQWWLVKYIVPKLMGYARKLTRTREECEDLTQVTLCRAWIARDTCDTSRLLDSWLCAIMKRLRIDDVRAANTLRRCAAILPLDAVNCETVPDLGIQSMRGVIELIDLERAAPSISLSFREQLYRSAKGQAFGTKYRLFHARTQLRKAATL